MTHFSELTHFSSLWIPVGRRSAGPGRRTEMIEQILTFPHSISGGNPRPGPSGCLDGDGAARCRPCPGVWAPAALAWRGTLSLNLLVYMKNLPPGHRMRGVPFFL